MHLSPVNKCCICRNFFSSKEKTKSFKIANFNKKNRLIHCNLGTKIDRNMIFISTDKYKLEL